MKNIKRISVRTITAFLATLILCFSLVFIMVLNRTRVEQLTMEQLIMEKSTKINDVMSKLLYKTQVLSTLVQQSNGQVENFEQFAASIVDDPAIVNILIAPDGVVSNVYPLEDNQAVVGLDFLAEGAGNAEAVQAIETGQLVLGGPFESVAGGQILVGRQPVYIEEPDGSSRFWGLVSVTLKYPKALDGAGLSELKIQGFAYEIWRINPDTNEKQIISDSGHSYNKNTNYIEKHIPILNADWYFRVLPVKAWYEFYETKISILISICVSILVAVIIQNNQNLKGLKDRLETLSNTDVLTGIYNRRYFMESVARKMDRVIRTNSRSFVIILDIDHFKKVNDKYKHQAGDTVLKEITARITRTLRSYDLFARYGGEEFIIFVSEIDHASVKHLVERIRLIIAETPVNADGVMISVTASFGIAPAAPVNNLDTAIALADDALYIAKNEGRNKVVFHKEI